MGWGLRGWSGVGGSFLRFCRGAWKSVRAVAEPPSHRKPTSTPHPWRAENMWQLVQQTCIWEKLDGFISSFFSKACQEDSVPRRKQEILDSLVYVSACDPESVHRRTTKQINRPHQKQAPSVFSWGYKSVLLSYWNPSNLLAPVYMFTLALKCNTSQQQEMGLLCPSFRMTDTWKWNTNKCELVLIEVLTQRTDIF